ncbi:MAG: hypothetical protein ACFFB5_20760 [Promethearchaeota archaeon]
MKGKDKNKPVQYLSISGYLSPDNKLYLRPSYLTLNSMGVKNFEESPLTIALYNDEQLLLQWGANLGSRTYPKLFENKDKFKRLVTNETLFVKSKIPFPEGANRITFIFKDIEIHEIIIPAGKPIFEEEVKIEERDEDTYRVYWKATHSESIPLYFTVRTSADGGINWRRIASRLTINEIMIKKEALIGGENCLIEIIAYNNVNTISSTLKVPDAKPLQLVAKIMSPKQGDEAISPPVKLRSLSYFTGKKTIINKPKYTWKINNELIAETQNAILYKLEPGEYKLELNVLWEKLEAEDSVIFIVEENNKFQKKRDKLKPLFQWKKGSQN